MPVDESKAASEQPNQDDYKAERIRLKQKSMLERAAQIHDEMRKLKPEDVGKDNLTFLQRPYARSQPREAVRRAPVWFTAYMPSIVGREHDNEMTRPLETLCDLKLWGCLAELGVRAIHTGPVMKAGGSYLNGMTYKSIDGWFDPVALEIDPDVGTERDYSRLVWIAENMPGLSSEDNLGAIVIGDIVPGHTGMGPDFHLALQGADHYPGLYVLARVDQVLDRHDKRYKKLSESQLQKLRDDITGDPSAHEFTRLLDQSEVDALVAANVIPGTPQRPMGPQAGSGWSITNTIKGVPDENGVRNRRWVYLHFFHPKQPTLNFFDPGYAAWRLITGQLNYMVWDLRSTGIRLDANAFLGIEPNPVDLKPVGPGEHTDQRRQTWSEAHPLSQVVTNMLAWQTRRLNGFSFQEMNMSVPDIASSAEFGPDLAYDFVTRPACEHAILTGDVSLLEFMFREMEQNKLDPGTLVHALQNHDEITYEFVHFAHLEREASTAGSRPTNKFFKTAEALRIEMRREALGRTGSIEELSRRTTTDFYNKESPNGLCTTLAGLIAARLGCNTLDEAYHKGDEIQDGHLLLAAFNAFQPGVFAISGWDLVGALPVEEDRLPKVLLNAGPSEKSPLEKDYRWVNRGAFKLLRSFGSKDFDSKRRYGCFDLPEARALYGPLDEQQESAGSFFCHLKKILLMRTKLGIPTGTFKGVLSNIGPGVIALLTLLNEAGTDASYALALFNFRRPTLEETPSVIPLKSTIRERWPELSVDSLHIVDTMSDSTFDGESYEHESGFCEAPDLQELRPWRFKLFHLFMRSLK